jgi:large subunit ribosomal protein L17
MALFRHERIITTLEKAKAVRPFVEKLITLAKNASLTLANAADLDPESEEARQAKAVALHSRRLVLSRLGPPSNAAVNPSDDENEADDRKVIVKLFDEIGPRFKDRPGGYTRVIKRHERRLGDGGKTAFLELLKEGETKVRSIEAPAPAPAVEDETEQEEEESAAEQTESQTPPEGEHPPAPEGATSDKPPEEGVPKPEQPPS